MLGNMIEWCQDRYREHHINDDIILREPLNEEERLLRGGSFDDPPTYVRSANRYRSSPASHETNFGFRPSRTYP